MATIKTSNNPGDQPLFGLGLRHAHYQDALTKPHPIDFVEIHSENFFAKGGVSQNILQDISEKYPISLHSTAMGLGSNDPVPSSYLNRLSQLVETTNPLMISDHASFSRASYREQSIHIGDLLPLAFQQDWLVALADNVDQVQQLLGRQILVENLSAYLTFDSNSMSETEFLNRLVDLTGCGLLIDLNNLIVNAHNQCETDILAYGKSWVDAISSKAVGEIHLAGFSSDPITAIIVDDHSQSVSHDCWQLYRHALKRFGATPTLIEWDNNLPDWNTLLREVRKARTVAAQVFGTTNNDICSKFTATEKQIITEGS